MEGAMRPVRLSRGAQRLLDLLCWYGSRFDRIFVFQEKLAKHLGVKIRRLREYVFELKGAELIEVHKCGRSAAEYELCAEAIAAKKCRSSAGLAHVEGRRPLITVSVSQKCATRKLPASTDWSEVTRLSRAGVPFGEALRRATA
jgi:hypothetical protein